MTIILIDVIGNNLIIMIGLGGANYIILIIRNPQNTVDDINPALPIVRNTP